jgi:DNA polymerase I-like protein with 3'-5' exonuclease and polymerase domains
MLHSELPPETCLVATVHDEVIIETALERAQSVKEWASTVMVEEMSLLVPGVPIEVESKICRNWSEKSVHKFSQVPKKTHEE